MHSEENIDLIINNLSSHIEIFTKLISDVVDIIAEWKNKKDTTDDAAFLLPSNS